MPIRPQHRWLYPIDWQQLTDMVRFERAKGRCEHCQRPHGKIVCHRGDGRWWDEDASRWRDDRGRAVHKAPPARSQITPRRRGSISPQRTWIIIRVTITGGTCGRSVSAAISFTTGPNICDADASASLRLGHLEICLKGGILFRKQALESLGRH
jgi:hypothetical protein